jgi:predicted Zn-dependent peptidase
VAELAYPVEGEGTRSAYDGARLAYEAVAFEGKVGELPAAAKGILFDLERLASRPLDGPTLDYARWIAALDLAYAYDDLSDAVAGVARQWLRGLPPDGLEALGAQLADVTPESLEAFASRVTGREVVVIAGDAGKLGRALEAVGLAPEVIDPRAPAE